MKINEIKEQVEQSMGDKQEFADLAFHLVPQLIAEVEKLQDYVESLEEDSEFLSCLEACGVDNWQGYDDAQQMMSEEDDE